jgi:hypothetical protein
MGAGQKPATPEVVSNLRDLEADRKTVGLFVSAEAQRTSRHGPEFNVSL